MWWHVLDGPSRCSFEGNDIGAEGASAVAAGLVHVPQLQQLKYVAWQNGAM